MLLSEEQVTALAPDTSSVKAGKGLASAAKWPLLGVNEKALWGHCKGSGKRPYQTQVDLQNIAFKCSCPSRKFPCKHGLGLLYLYARDTAAFAQAETPDWVSEWLDKRNDRAEKKAEKKAKPVDEKAQAKRTEARMKKVHDGVEELQIWMKDLIRNGLLNIPNRAYEYWQAPAKRMIDAQAPGLAGRLKALGNINYFDDQWTEELLQHLGQLYLLTESFKNLEALPEDFQEEVKSLIGFNQNKEELLQQEGVQDQWLVLSRTLEEEEQLKVERNWLYGQKSKRFALVLQFFVRTQVSELKLMPGTSFQGELVFYPGVHPYRALLKQQEPVKVASEPVFEEELSKAMLSFADAVIRNPFHEKIPLLLGNMHFVHRQEASFFMDQKGKAVYVQADERMKMQLLAITGGYPCQVFVLADDKEVQPKAVWVGEQFYPLTF
ncbi:SWIM zinc finger family protein [Rapidithrix thailandica]|uniref:SWIM zinc finger family protein n=1 Tax=Rapidithrix thailandica TaxID=413964 RepID=A0AAW9S3E2_9BACT